jgi:LemA protein
VELLLPLAIVGGLALLVISSYNGLVNARNRVDEALGQIQVQLKRRYDLIPNLVEAVKGQMGFEKGVLESVTAARAAAVNAGATGNTAAQAKAENLLTSSLRTLFANVEAYPTLKSNSVQSFPGLLFAGAFGFAKRDFFDAPDAEEVVPKVSLS